MSAMNRAIGMDMQPRLLTVRLLGFEHAIQRRGGALSEVHSGCHAAVVGDHREPAVFMHDLNRPAIKQIAVLAKDERFRTFANHRWRGQNKDVAILFDGHIQPRSLAGPKAPDLKRFAIFCIAPGLIR